MKQFWSHLCREIGGAAMEQIELAKDSLKVLFS